MQLTKDEVISHGGTVSQETIAEIKALLDNPSKSGHVIIAVPPGVTIRCQPLNSTWSSESTH